MLCKCLLAMKEASAESLGVQTVHGNNTSLSSMPHELSKNPSKGLLSPAHRTGNTCERPSVYKSTALSKTGENADRAGH